MVPSDSLAADLAILKSEISHVRIDMERIIHMMNDGHTKGLVSRVAVTEEKLHSHEQDFKRMENQMIATKTAFISAALSFIVAASISIFEIITKMSK